MRVPRHGGRSGCAALPAAATRHLQVHFLRPARSWHVSLGSGDVLVQPGGRACVDRSGDRRSGPCGYPHETGRRHTGSDRAGSRQPSPSPGRGLATPAALARRTGVRCVPPEFSARARPAPGQTATPLQPCGCHSAATGSGIPQSGSSEQVHGGPHVRGASRALQEFATGEPEARVAIPGVVEPASTAHDVDPSVEETKGCRAADRNAARSCGIEDTAIRGLQVRKIRVCRT